VSYEAGKHKRVTPSDRCHIDEVAAGDIVLIEKRGAPVAELRPAGHTAKGFPPQHWQRLKKFPMMKAIAAVPFLATAIEAESCYFDSAYMAKWHPSFVHTRAAETTEPRQ